MEKMEGMENSEYRQALYGAVDKLFMEVVMPYGKTNTEANKRMRKFSPFQKKNYDDVVARFDIHRRQAELIEVSRIQVPEADKAACKLKEDFVRCRASFMNLCRRNKEFYELQNRRMRKEPVDVEELKDLTLQLKAALEIAGQDIDQLEFQYKVMKGGITAEKLRELGLEEDV